MGIRTENKVRKGVKIKKSVARVPGLFTREVIIGTIADGHWKKIKL